MLKKFTIITLALLAGEVTQHINGDGEVHAYVYDDVSRLSQTTDPEGYVKAFAYDLRDNISTVTDGRGGLTTFGYDPLDRMLTRTNPIGQSMTRVYDTRDNLATLTREDGMVETASYDGLSRRTLVTTPDNVLAYTFDPRGNLTAANDNDSGVGFTYDARNRLATTTTDGTKGPQPAVTLTYGYDMLDRRVSLTDSLGGSTAYTYDVEDRLTDLTAPWGTVYSFGYDGDGRRTSLSSTSGRNSSMGYTNGLLTALSHVQSGVSLTDLAYEYGPDGQLTGIIDQLDPSASKAISYDALNRLLQVAEGIPAPAGTPIPVEDYAYDGEGNRTASHLSNLYSSNDHNQLEGDDTYTYAYDDKGNRESRTAKSGGAVETYGYDSQNRLISYASPTTTASYAYDAMDRRAAKVVDGVVTAFVYDLWSHDSTTNEVLLDFVDGSLTKRWLHGVQVDEPLGFEVYSGTTAGGSGAAHEVFADRLGSVIEVVESATNTVVASNEYDSFGSRTTTGTLTQRYGFTGREHDAESDLIHYRARTFDPAVGQFLQRDPIGFASGDLNLYAYVENDPLNWSDPSGLMAGTMTRDTSFRNVSLPTISAGTLGLAANIARLLSFSIVLSVSGDTPDNPAKDKPVSDTGKCDPNDLDCVPDGCTGGEYYGDVNFDGMRSDGDLGSIPFKSMSAELAFWLVGQFDTSIANRIGDQWLHEQRFGRDEEWYNHQDRIDRDTQARKAASDRAEGNKC